MRIRTSDGTVMMRSNENLWVWTDEILDIWISEKSMSWPKWSLYSLKEEPAK